MFTLIARLAAFVLTLAATSAHAEFRDRDWNAALLANCRLPSPQAVTWAGTAQDPQLAFTLNPGDRGGCRADTRRRNGAPYWERAELIQAGHMPRGTVQEISFTANFTEGFLGQRETFFQIHGWTKSCNAAPLLMLQFHQRQMRAMVLTADIPGSAERGNLRQKAMGTPRIDDLIGRDTQFRILFDQSGPQPTLTLIVNGRTLMKRQPVHMAPCAKPAVKMGIYRPGAQNPARSALVIDDLLISRQYQLAGLN